MNHKNTASGDTYIHQLTSGHLYLQKGGITVDINAL